MLEVHRIERERERSLFLRGYRYTLRDQDTTWPAAYETKCRGHDEREIFTWVTGMVI